MAKQATIDQDAEPGPNPDWTRDELILALDLYFQFKGNPPGKKSAEIVGFSETLRALWQDGTVRRSNFRNPNGVYMKVMNFRRFDPLYKDQGKVGLSRGNKLEGEVWADFAGDAVRIREVASAIRATVDGTTSVDLGSLEPTISDAPEGRILTRTHEYRERNPKIVNDKKKDTLKRTGKLVCEACGFDYEAVYGKRGTGFIEAHHLQPLHTYEPGQRTSKRDLALVCANCHRMIHAAKPWLTLDELRLILNGTG